MGVIAAIDTDASLTVTKVFIGVAAGGWILMSILQFYTIGRLLRIYRSTGGSLDKIRDAANAEAGNQALSVAQSEVGRSVVKGAAKAAWDANA